MAIGWIEVAAGTTSALAAVAGVVIAILRTRSSKQHALSVATVASASVWDAKVVARDATLLKIEIEDHTANRGWNRGWTVQIAADKPFEHVMGYTNQTTHTIDIEPVRGRAGSEGEHELFLFPSQLPLIVRCRVARRGEGAWSDWSDPLTLKAVPGYYGVAFTSH